MPQVVVVGAGISGLATAFRLHQLRPDLTVTVLESATQPGGTIQTRQRAGFLVECGPNGFLDNKPSTVNLCRDLNLGGELVAASEASAKNRYLFLGKQLKPLPGSLAAFFKSDLLSWKGKLSFLMERFRARGVAEDETIDAFATRRAGPEVAATFADALVTGIHAGDPKLLSFPAAFPRLAAFEREHGSVMKGLSVAAKAKRAEAQARGEPYRRGSQLWTLRAGLGQLIDALVRCLPQPPRWAAPVQSLGKSTKGWLVRTDQEMIAADAVVLACPAYQQATIVGGLDELLGVAIGGISYNRVAVVALGYRRSDVPLSLDGFGYIAPQRLRRDVLGVQWCSSIFPGRAPADAVLMRGMCGGWHRADVVDWDDATLLEAMRAEIRLALGITALPVFQEIVRWDRAIPQYFLGHLTRVAQIEAKVAQHGGLFLTGNAFHGVALNDCTENAERVARLVAGYVAQSAS